MTTLAGVDIEVPTAVSSSGPVMLRVTMVADMPTYYANNGVLDRVLTIVCVRRDRAGVRFVATLDPHAYMTPEPALPPPDQDSDMQGYIREEREFDMLGYGASHDGAADYYVLAAFAKWLSEPAALSLTDSRRSLSVTDTVQAPDLPEGEGQRIPAPPDNRGVVARIFDTHDPHVVGALRVAVRGPRFPDERSPGAFVTVVAVNLGATGGVSAQSFLLDSNMDGVDRVAQFSIPLRLLMPRPEPGTYRVLVFSGDEKAQPLDALIPVR